VGETTNSIRRDIDRERHQLEDNLEGIEAKVQQTTHQVQEKVEDIQHQVQDKVEDVQEKIKDATDWRVQFEKRPMVGLAVAFGGGVLLASMMGSGNDSRRSSGNYYGGYQAQPQSFSSHQGHSGTDVGRQHVSSTFDNVKGALLGVAAAQLKTVLSDALPGFSDEYSQVEKEQGSSGSKDSVTRQSQSGTTQASGQYSDSGERKQSI
jgi:uncharacterized protein YjbJ (UPF0337 family)